VRRLAAGPGHPLRGVHRAVWLQAGCRTAQLRFFFLRTIFSSSIVYTTVAFAVRHHQRKRRAAGG